MFNKPLHLIALFLTFFLSQLSTAQEITLTDRITGHVLAASNSLNNQVAGAGGRQVLLTQVSITAPTIITRVRQLSNSTLTSAAAFEYAIRSVTSPFNLIETGPATLASRSAYTDVTSAGNNSNLDEFTFSTSQLSPGTYYLAVYASDGNTYQLLANSTGPTEPLLAENGGVPFLAGANFHMFVSHFGTVASTSATGVPSLPPLRVLFLGVALAVVARYGQKRYRKAD